MKSLKFCLWVCTVIDSSIPPAQLVNVEIEKGLFQGKKIIVG
jgi:hypothetical protein